MALLQTFSLAHLPPSLAIHVVLYQDVKNAEFLQQQLLQGNPEFEYAFVDASVVGSGNLQLHVTRINFSNLIDTLLEPYTGSSV